MDGTAAHDVIVVAEARSDDGRVAMLARESPEHSIATKHGGDHSEEVSCCWVAGQPRLRGVLPLDAHLGRAAVAAVYEAQPRGVPLPHVCRIDGRAMHPVDLPLCRAA